MRKFFLFTILMIALSVNAQETLTVKFTAATAAGGYSPFTSVLVTDLTQGWITTLTYPDTTLVLSQSLVGVDEWQGRDLKMGSPFPNPFTDHTTVPLELSETSEVILQLIRVDGKVVSAQDLRLDAGAHQVMVRLSTPGMAFLRVATPNGNSVARLVCLGGGADDVRVVSRDGALGRGGNPGVFEPGDLMRYEAFYSAGGTTSHSEVVEQAQYDDETVTLVFPVEAPVGAIDGLYTINEEGGKVFFSKGNLQYDMNLGIWSFMEHQYDRVETLGQDVGQNYATQNIVSLFGWSTSGYNHGAQCYQPWSTSTTYYDYHAYANHNFNLYDQTGQADWGYNAITNGGNTEHLWRTLTTEEWDYIIESRDTPSGIRFAKARVGEVNGVILLPDDWSGSYFSLNFPNTTNVYYENNPISLEQWEMIEQHGAVFLPAAGYRLGTDVLNMGSSGHYWSSSHYNEDRANCVSIFDSGLYPQAIDFIFNGFSVRLVQVAH